MLNKLAPIILFTYNRPWHTKQTLIALNQNKLANQSKLYIFSDGPKKNTSVQEIEKIKEVRTIISSQKWCKDVKIIERKENWGLAKNIVDGVTQIINQYGKVIVLEDDIVTSKGFLQYMNNSLKLYKDEASVMHISGYMLPIKGDLPETFFYNVTSCWGWGTWLRAWQHYQPDAKLLLSQVKDIRHFNVNNSYDFYSHLVGNINGKLHTWAIKWYASVFLKNGLCLHPKMTLVKNIGTDGSGEHSNDNDSVYNSSSLAKSIAVEKILLGENPLVLQEIQRFHNQNKSVFRRFTFKVKSFLYQLSFIKSSFIIKS